MHECICREPIWKDYKINEIVEAVLSGELPSMGPHAHNCPKTLHDLKVKCLASNPERRPTFAQITVCLNYLKEEIEQSNVQHYRKVVESTKRGFSIFNWCCSKSSVDVRFRLKSKNGLEEYS